ncbi:50S ribosomal protein L22 [Candidatus Wolfebacteria bacterium]|nr:50S ribosomal protein L22 [Candidatus Wolfebacteria bacterium]
MNLLNKKSVKNNTLPDREAVLSLKGEGKKTQIAKLNHLKIAPRKVRLVASSLRGLSVSEAEAQLLLTPKKSGLPILKLLRSAVSNAKNTKQLNPEKLFIKEIRVDQGPVLKRFSPRAMGRATTIQKKSSHLILTLAESDKLKTPRFKIVSSKKVFKSKKTEKAAQTSGTSEKETEKIRTEKSKLETKETKKAAKHGFMKKFFRRKSV